MVAATIERCPRSMMLRELVVNAIEAASGAQDAQKRVVVDAVTVDGARKLRIWNTGRGLDANELLTITDLSSSLFKTVGLVDNFGVGAKAASLTSNRHGLRYRSCRAGRVSEVILGERGGIYGRLRRRQAGRKLAEVSDVTETCRSEGEHALDHDWTEVTRFGNSPEQDTVRDPYAGEPDLGPDWVAQTLGKRFVRLPADVTLDLRVGRAPGPFVPSLGAPYFDEVEEVAAPGGIVIRYAYRAEDSARPRPPLPAVGLGAVIYADEVYALADGRRWLLEAPSYGFTFAARRITVTVELPRDFPVHPEQYRQFLRFGEGEQRQVQVADFGDLIRAHIPAWLRRIIAAMRPGEKDYLAEINSDLERLLSELGIEEMLWQPERSKRETREQEAAPPPEQDEAAPPEDGASSPPEAAARPRIVPPPEIIVVEDEEQLAEKALAGRAARFYPGERQLFVNARYEAFQRLAAGLQQELAAAADPETVRFVAREAAEWALIGRLARTLVHSLGKKSLGWSEDEVKAAQSPETMSLMVDDFTAELSTARRRAAVPLGLEDEAGTVSEGAGWRVSDAQREAADLAQAEADLQRAITNKAALGRFYCNLARILMRRGETAEALAVLERGVAADPDDAWCHYEIAGIHLAKKDYESAARAAETASELAQSAPFLRRLIEVSMARGADDRALALVEDAIARYPDFPWFRYDLSTLMMRKGDLEGADEAIGQAIATKRVAPYILRLAEIERKRGNVERAVTVLDAFVADEPTDASARLGLARLLADRGDADAALTVLDEGLALGTASSRGALLRGRSDVEMRRGNAAGALAAASAACEADPGDVTARFARARILIGLNDFEGAEEAIGAAARLSPEPHPGLLRMRAMIARLQQDYGTARSLLEEALAIAPADPWTYIELSNLALAEGEFANADAAAAAAAARMKGLGNLAERRRSEIAFIRGDAEAGWHWLDAAMASDPADPGCRLEASARYLSAGDHTKARTKVDEAIALVRQPSLAMLRRLWEIETARNDKAAVRAALERAVALYPSEPYPWSELSRFLVAEGDLANAQKAAERALELKAPAAAA